MKNVCLDLREHAIKIINYEKKKMISVTKEEKKIHREKKVSDICTKRFSIDDDNKTYHKLRDYCHFTEKYRGTVHDICNLRYKTPK